MIYQCVLLFLSEPSWNYIFSKSEEQEPIWSCLSLSNALYHNWAIAIYHICKYIKIQHSIKMSCKYPQWYINVCCCSSLSLPEITFSPKNEEQVPVWSFILQMQNGKIISWYTVKSIKISCKNPLLYINVCCCSSLSLSEIIFSPKVKSKCLFIQYHYIVS